MEQERLVVESLMITGSVLSEDELRMTATIRQRLRNGETLSNPVALEMSDHPDVAALTQQLLEAVKRAVERELS